MSSARDGSGNMSMNTVTTVMAFSVSAFFVLFVFTRLLCARIQLRSSAAAAAAATAHADAFPAIHVERGISGLEPSVVTSFPTAKFDDDGSHSRLAHALEESQCTVCLEEYEAKDVVRVLPYCGHAFHVACIDAWLNHHSTCPVCRASLRATGKHRAAAAVPPVHCATARGQALLELSSTSSSSVIQEAHGRLEIVSEEPAVSDAGQVVAAPPPHPHASETSLPGTASEQC